jgi:preprotein translocase subunit YajC
VFFGIFYFLAIRPQRRQKAQHSEMVQMLKRGDEVVTIGGMFGTVTKIGDDWVELEVAKRTRVRYLKRAVSSITNIVEDEDEDEYIEAEEEDVEELEAEPDTAQLEEETGDVEAAGDEVIDAEAAGEEVPEAPRPPKEPGA